MTTDHGALGRPIVSTFGEGVSGAVGSTWHHSLDPFTAFAANDEHTVGQWFELLGAVAGVVSLPTDLIDAAAAGVTAALPAVELPALTMGPSTWSLGSPHLHASTVLAGVPLIAFGPAVMVGALTVQLGGAPALRCGDAGISPTCMSLTPIFKIITGSSSVFVGGKRAVRCFDLSIACSPAVAAAAGTSVIAQRVASAIGVVGRVLMVAGIVSTVAKAGEDAYHAGTGGDSDSARMVELQGAGLQLTQAVADAALGAFTGALGGDPGIPGCMGVMIGVPTSRVLIGGIPCPEASMLTDAAVAWLHRRGAHASAHPEANPLCTRPGEPVRVENGSVFAGHIDLERGGLRFARFYDTRARHRIGDCGRGVRHTYERELEVWLHRCTYVDHEGVRVDFPAFRGGDDVALAGYVLTRLGGGRYEVVHRGETMSFAAVPGVRAARLVEIRVQGTACSIEHDSKGRFAGVRVGVHGITARRDLDGRIVSIRDEHGAERVAYAFDRRCLVAARDANGGEERFAYDDRHRLVERCDPRGYRFAWQYDDESRCVHTSGEDGQWSCDFVYAKNATTVTHGNGLVETFHYDAYGTVLKIKRSDGTFLLREQDELGRIVRERDGAGRTIEWLYDDTGAHVGRRDRFGNELPPERDTPRDAPSPLDRELPATHAARLGLEPGRDDGTTSVPDSLDALAAWALPTPSPDRAWSSEKDALGRVTRVVDARGLGTDLRRDVAGNVVEITDRDRRVTRALIIGWNLVGSVIDPIGRRVDATYTTTEEVRTYREPSGSLTEYGRDVADRLVSITRDGKLVERYVHDAGGRLVEKTSGTGETLLRVTHHRNALPKNIALAEGGTIELDYDARGRATRAKLGEHDARLERDADRTVLFDRIDGRGVRRWRLGLRETTSLLERFETRIDRTGDLTVVRDPAGGLTTFDASARGRVVRRLANGTTEILAIDPEGRLEGRLAHRRASDGALTSWAVRYERSAEGDLLGLWDTARGERRFELDAANRLEAERDEHGAHHSYAHDASDEVVAFRSRRRVEHDARDRVSRRDGDRYAYDSLDQLVAADLANGARWRGSYDGLGRLRRFGVEGRETFLYWDGDRIAAEVAPDSALRVHVYSDARALIPFAFVDYASVDAEPDSGRAYYVFHDASGMPLQIQDASGRTVWWADRVDPYGAITPHEGAELDYALRWPGHYFDRDLGLHHNRFRAYDPELARYLQPDPIGHAGSPHGLHAYAPNPLVDVDLLGLSCPLSPTHADEEPTEGHPLHEAPTGTIRNAVGRLINAVTKRWVRDPDAPPSTRRRANVLMTRTEITNGREVRLRPETEPVHTYLRERSTALEEARLARDRGDTDAANAWQARANTATEHLGEEAAHAEVKNRYPDAELLHRGSGPGQFDGVYRIPGDPPRILVVEAKGGSSRETSSRAYQGDQVQQGTQQYAQAVAEQQQQTGLARGDQAMSDAAAAVAAAGDNIEYISVRQPIDSNGDLGDVRVSRYGASVRVGPPVASGSTSPAPASASP